MSKTLYFFLFCAVIIQVINCSRHESQKENKIEARGIVGDIQKAYFKILPLINFIKRIFSGMSGPIGRSVLNLLKWLPFLLVPMLLLLPMAKWLLGLLFNKSWPILPNLQNFLPNLQSYIPNILPSYSSFGSPNLLGSGLSGLSSPLLSSGLSPGFSSFSSPLSSGYTSYSSSSYGRK